MENTNQLDKYHLDFARWFDELQSLIGKYADAKGYAESEAELLKRQDEIELMINEHHEFQPLPPKS